MKKFLQFIFVFLLFLIPGIGRGYTLPTDRAVTWQGNVGVVGDIPTRNTICATLNPSGGNDSSAIQAAINACPVNQVVKLNSGTFNINTFVQIKSGVTLRGSGMGVTILKGISGMTGGNVVGTSGYSTGTSVDLSAGLTKGSTSITTSSPHGWAQGDIILIDQLNDTTGDPLVNPNGEGGLCTWCGRGSSGARALGQIVKVTAVPTTTTATLEIPLYWTFDVSLSPQATKLNGITSNVGMEDFTADNSLSGNSGQNSNYGTVALTGASNSWVYRVEAIGSWLQMVMMNGAYRNTVRSCEFHEGVPALPTNGTQYSGRAYGVRLSPYASANLIENNHLYHLGMAVVMNGATSGNVIAYNNIHDLYDTATNWNKTAISFHGAHPIMNLVEGNNIRGKFAADYYWGSSSHNTYFRNKTAIETGKASAMWAVDLQKNIHYFNFIGNSFGTYGVENTYELIAVNLTGQKAIYRLGYTSDGDNYGASNDATVAPSILRHGNWDSVNNNTIWNGSDDRTLPDSLYLTQKPNWWGTDPWPKYGGGTIYYVDATSGNNANTGLTPETAWQTISKVNTISFQAGDTIKFKSGDYGTTTLTPLTNGNAGSLITFTSYDNATTKPILRGGANLNGRSYIKLDKLDLTSTGITISASGGSRNIISNNNIYSTAVGWGPTISFRNGSHFNQLINNTISQAQSFNDIINLRNDADNNLIAYNNITIQNSHAAIDLEGYSVDDGQATVGDRTSNYNIIKGNKIRGHNGGGVHITLQANAFYNVVEGNDLRGDGTLNSFCYLLHPSQQPSRSQAIMKGVGNYNIIRNNILANYPCQDSEGLFFDTYEYGGFNNGVNNTMIYGNVVTGIGSGGTGLYIAIGGGTGTISNNYIKNNILFNNGGLTWTRDLDGAVSSATALTQMREHLDANYYNNNIIYSTKTNGVVWLGDNYFSVAQADAVSAKWSNNFQVDPKLDPTTLLPLANSPAIGNGAALTTITSAGGTGTSFAVENARYFSDGNSLINGDVIQVNGQRTTIMDITYGTGLSGTLTVYPEITWTQGMEVNMAFDGSAPPIGLFAATGEGGIITPVLPTSFAINVGGPLYTSGDGTTFVADSYGTGGTVGATAIAINGTNDDILYQTERWGSTFSYDIPMQNGSYNLILSFAELFWTAEGRRVFDIFAEGALVGGNIDIFSLTGGNTAYDLVIPVTISDEILNLTLTASIDNASLRAIKIIPTTSTTVTAIARENGALDASTPSPATVNLGSTTSFTFNSSPNYHISTISGCSGQAYTNTSNLIASHTYTTGNVTTPCAVTANFALNQFALSFVAGSNGALTGVTSQTISYNASSSSVTAVADDGYHFKNWTGTNGFVATTDNPLTVNAVTASSTITANFEVNDPIPLVDGVCGSAHGASLQTIPIGNLCETGTPSAVEGNGPWSWTCIGSGGGTTASCIAARNFCASARLYLPSNGFITGSFM